MMSALSLPFFQTAALAALVLAGIHAYLGFHIVRRGVLFVDLALAQMAALGVAIGIVLGHEHDETTAYALALATTMAGAAIFAWLRGRARNVPLEAFIGIVFATAQALAFLLLEKTPSGAEHLRETQVGSLFTVDPEAHWRDRAHLPRAWACCTGSCADPFFEITTDPEGAERRGRRLFFWDFLFYATFGLVVTLAVQIAGVLLVFGFLVIPAVAGLMASTRPGVALAIGWVFGFSASVVGLLGAASWDFPAAPAILVTLTLMLMVHGALLVLWRRVRRGGVSPAGGGSASR